MSCTAVRRMFPPVLLVAVLLASACNMPSPFQPQDKSVRSDRDAPFDPPSNYYEWAYEQPSYMKPVDELSPAPSVRQGDPLHYFTNRKLVEIRQPANYTPEEIPRVAVWWTDNNGFHWHQAGYFGRGQSFFPFEAADDGDYGIRFVGPGQEPAKETPAYPERVYHLDTTPPEVEVAIDPEQSQYEAGQMVTISWRASDFHLIETPVAIKAIMDFAADEPRVVELQRDLADEGSITYQISEDAADQQIRFRAEAIDRANNLGLAYSYALQVVAPGTGAPAEPEAAAAEAESAESTAAGTDNATVVPAALTGSTDEPLDPTPAVSTTTDPAATPAGPPDGWNEIVSAVEVDLLGGGPMVTPFVQAVPRAAPRKTGLTWEGGEPQAYPGGESLDARRSERRLFDGQASEHPIMKAAGELKQVLVNAAAAREAEKAQEANRYSMLPSDEETAEEAAPEDDEPAVATADVPETTPSDAAAVADPAEEPLPPSPIARLVTEIKTASYLDLTQGNGLMVPLPATVDQDETAGRVTTIHPWRILGEVLSAPVQAVWMLPRGRLGIEMYRLLDGRFLADNPVLRAVAEPGSARSEFAQGSAEDGEPETEDTP